MTSENRYIAIELFSGQVMFQIMQKESKRIIYFYVFFLKDYFWIKLGGNNSSRWLWLWIYQTAGFFLTYIN